MSKIAKVKVADNLYIYSRENGNEYYVFRGTVDGKRIERSLGTVDSIGLRDAKHAVAVCLTSKVEEKSKAAQITFAEFLPIALEGVYKLHRWKTQEQYDHWRNTLCKHAVPVLGDKPVDTITRQDIFELLDPLWTALPPTAALLRARLEALFEWGIDNGYCDDPNPALWKGTGKGKLCARLPPLNKVHKVEHFVAPTMDELRYAVRYIRAHPSKVRACLLFVIATVCRVDEACKAEPDELQPGVWVCPGKHRKTNDTLRIPLSSLAEEALAMASQGAFIFTGDKGAHVDRRSVLGNLQAMCPRLAPPKPEGEEDDEDDDEPPQVTIHGVRSTFRDWCALNHESDAEAEKALGHRWGTDTTVAYYRTDLLEQRRALMQRWADALTNEEEP